MWWFLVGSAHAWSLVAGDVWDVGGAASEVVLVERDGDPYVLVATGSSVRVLDGAGALVGERVGAADDVTGEDVDGDGLADLVICDALGLSWVPWTTSGFGAAATIDSVPCVAVLASDVGGEGLAVAYPDGTVQLWFATGSGFTGPAPTEIALSGPPLVAAQPGTVAAASPGDVVLQELDEWGVSQLAAGGPIAGVALRDDWVLALGGDDPRLREIGGEVVALDGAPLAVGVGDADGDGVADLWALQDAELVVTTADGEVRRAAITGDRLAVGDLDGDGCADAIVHEDGALAVVRVDLCPLLADLDGDGWDADAGDCDDADPDVHPEAFERCNGLDDDCDGAVDETDELFLRVPEDALEGEIASIWADVPGCDELEPVLTLAFDPWVASCAIVGAEAECDLFDDAVVIARAEVFDADGGLLFEAEASFEVGNVAPWIDWSSSVPDGDIELVEGDSFSVELEGHDAGNDQLAFRIVGTDPDATLSPSGLLVVNARDAWDRDIRVEIRDDDGGSAAYTLSILVQPADTGFGEDDDWDCGEVDLCGGWGCALGVPALLGGLALRRRRR